MLSRILRPAPGAVITPLHWNSGSPAPGPVKHSPALHAFFPEERPAQERQATDQEKCEAAYQSGFLAGQASAGESMQGELQAALKDVASMITSLRASRAKLRRDAEEDLVQLSFNIARRILNRELSVDPEAILSLARLALEKVESRELIKVRVNPGCATALQQMAELSSSVIEADATLNSGDLILETTRGSLDASVGRQLSEIERGFADRMRIGS